jgi:major vault protein
MPTAEVEVKEKRQGKVLNDFTALHIRALKNFTDIYGVERGAGQEYLIDKSITDVHILDSNEELVQEKNIIALAQNQYVVIRNPVDKDGKP